MKVEKVFIYFPLFLAIDLTSRKEELQLRVDVGTRTNYSNWP